MKKGIILALTLCVTLVASDKQQNQQQIMKIGKESAVALFKTLEPKLQEKIKKDGFAKASEFCTNEAQKLTAEVNKNLQKGVSIKRISLKNRNPLNAPATKNEENILKSFDLLNSSGVMLRALVENSTNSYKFYKPLVIQKGVCLKCHGDENTIDKDAKALFSKKYSNDKAVGFKMGDVRGAIVVEINKEVVK